MLTTIAPYWPLAIIVCGAILFLPGLEWAPFRGEEGRRVLQALELLNDGDWWRLTVLGEPYVSKPPLLPWLMAGFGVLIGQVNEWAARLPGVVLTIAGALGAGAMASRLAACQRSLAALIGASAYLFSIYAAQMARVGETDMTAIAFTGLGFLCWAEARLSRRRAPWLAAASVALFALAFLAKGPIPVAFAALAMVATEVIERDWRRLLVAIAIILVAAVPLLVWVKLNSAVPTVEHTWKAELLRGAPSLSLAAWLAAVNWTVLPAALLLMCPWILLVGRWAWGPAIALPADRRWLLRALFLYAVPLGLAICFWPDSRPRYPMPALWPVAVLAGASAAACWRSDRLASTVVVAGILVATGWQVVMVGFIAGRTKDQRRLRSDGRTLHALVGSAGRQPNGVAVNGFPNHNLLAYAGRPLDRVGVADIQRLPPGAVVIADDEAAGTLRHSPDWHLKGSIGSTGLAVFTHR